ncbi:MAG: chemotaxis protein CheW [Archangiaceae bacterium]|nr:chemotaxis protein CheW [Archangiaceae bacterium]
MQLDDAAKEFLIESYEGLDQLDREFVALEADPQARARIAIIFRVIHTIKGTSGFLGLGKLESVTHAGESLLSLLREGTLTLSPPMTAALLALVDRVRAILKSVETTGSEGAIVVEDLKKTLLALADGTAAPAPPVTPPASPVVAAPAPVVAPPTTPAAEPAATPIAIAEPVAPASPASPVSGEAGASASVADTNVRVDVSLLDKLMNLVGELVLSRNQILQYSAHAEEPVLAAASQRLNLITTELQEQVMKTRMQPIGNVWAKLPRVVRDLATACGKQVRVEMRGKETELDRAILEAIKDPLTHIVRNSVDHGFESSAARAKAGKPKTGTLTLRAFHESGQCNIEISDDGGGLNIDAISKKALERGVVSEERLRRMSAHELEQLIFLPGFSTAEKVTNLSGRGVGMDVVKTNVEKIGGTVDLRSKPGAGTTVQIKIPLTLAIVPALTVMSGGQRYAIPQTHLVELVRLEGESARAGVERVHGAQVYRLRGRLLPLVNLGETFGLARTADAEADTGLNIIVVQADERQFGLVVDAVGDTEEIVVKPLGKLLKGCAVYAGATIMGDGRVALILDVAGLAQHARAVHAKTEQAVTAAAEALADGAAGEKQTLLLFSAGGETLALPLSSIARLEELPRARLERAGDRSVAQYRGGILPLIQLGESAPTDTGNLQVIVYSSGERSVGFVVEQVLDIVEETVRVERVSARPGVLGAAVVQGRVTDFLDVGAVARLKAPWLFEELR